jgi:hypothetical protein
MPFTLRMKLTSPPFLNLNPHSLYQCPNPKSPSNQNFPRKRRFSERNGYVYWRWSARVD